MIQFNVLLEIIIAIILLAISRELIALACHCGIKIQKGIGIILVIVVLTIGILFNPISIYVYIIALTVFIPIIFTEQSEVRDFLLGAIVLFVIVVIVGFTLNGLIFLIRRGETDRLLYFYLSIVIRDTFSSIYGRFLPGRLITQLSPNKTYQGALVGLIAVVILQLSLASKDGSSFRLALMEGITIGIIGQIGDLTASAIKRSANVRHSGRIFGRRGGMIDLFDSVIFTFPVWLGVISIFS